MLMDILTHLKNSQEIFISNFNTFLTHTQHIYIMDLEQTEYYQKYIKHLTEELVRVATQRELLGGKMIAVEEIDAMWRQMAPEYMADAVPELAKYPMAALGWAAYLGMGVAAIWETAWEKYADSEKFYDVFQKPRGFDQMDEFILEEMLSLELGSDEAKRIEGFMQSAAEFTLGMLRREQVEAGTSDAFYFIAHSARVLFELGVSIELHLLGYSYTKMKVPTEPVS